MSDDHPNLSDLKAVPRRRESPQALPREHKGQTAYKDLDKGRLLEILTTTENPHEYIAAVRGYHHWPREEMAERIGTTRSVIMGYERHGYLPDPAMLARAQAWFEPDEKIPSHARLEELVLRQRLRTAGIGMDKDKLGTTGRELMFMPDCYWQVMLQAHNDPQGWQAREDKPAWADVILPITTVGEYLYAVRNAMGMTREQVAKAARMSTNTVKNIENGSVTDRQMERVKEVLEGEEHELRAALGGLHPYALFDRERCEALPFRMKQLEEGQKPRRFADAFAAPSIGAYVDAIQ